MSKRKNERKPNDKKKNIEVMDLRVFDVPTKVATKFLALAKLHFDNQGWQCLEALLDLWLESESAWKVQTDMRIDRLEQRVFSKDKEEKDEDVVKTFGGN